jgi:hypothetical protein
MLPFIINPLPLLLTISTAFGVLVHDMHIDKFAVVALPAAIISYGASEVGLKLNDQHLHAERVSFSGSLRLNEAQPRVQPRTEDDKKYIAQKKLTYDAYGSDYRWPSD